LWIPWDPGAREYDMSDVAIRAEGLSKQYRIGERQKYKALRDTLTDALYYPFRCLQSVFNPSKAAVEKEAKIWALKDVSFEIKQGEVVGVIGRNGAGKSTLLKILSRITEPTEGFVDLHGRVGSLLEVGTGFHPELTGRDNVYLNGSIIGMKKREINRKFDEIVAFAEIEQFLDTPVKYYSSGMYMRLAFSVAAHLEPEILLVDEVLAVGDSAFQKKCLGRMSDVAREGRTVVFVSHQLNQIRRLCSHCVWLHDGKVRIHGSTVEVVSAYEGLVSAVSQGNSTETERPGRDKGTSHFVSWEVVGTGREGLNVFAGLGTFSFRIVVYLHKAIQDGHHGIALRSKNGDLMWSSAVSNLRLNEGNHEFFYKLPFLPLQPSIYQWQASLYEADRLLDNWLCLPELIVATEPMTHPRDEWIGMLNVPCEFHTKNLE
jgi:ABC-type polysaccharide/polyol phosphate transport system ATPase subunit